MNDTLNNLVTPIEKPIVFFHIPKTAGTNFTFVIENNYKDTCRRRDFSYIDERTGELKCAFGHYGYEKVYDNDCVMFVFLRNPVERIISHFVEVKANRDCDPKFTLEEMFFRRASDYFSEEYPKENFAERAGFGGDHPWMNNFYCRSLTGRGFRGTEPYHMTEDIADGIIQNIENNVLFYNGKYVPCVFGITERFKPSIDMFAKIAGWKTTKYVEKSWRRAYNKGRRKYPAKQDLVHQISRRNKLDLKIYRAARLQFDKQLEFFNK